MKSKLITLLAAAIVCIALSSCTRQSITRNYGGKMEIQLPPGQELMEATWKEDNLFYLTRPMADDYVPVNKTFQESSSWGILESTVIFIESR